jgi:hypothetical protein
MAKQIIELGSGVDKPSIDGSEVLPMQESAGGAGSTKRFAVSKLIAYFAQALSTTFASMAQGGKADTAVQSIVAGANISVDSTDPVNPIPSLKQSISTQEAIVPYRASISGAVSIDLNIVSSNNLHLTLTGNVTSFALINPLDGGVYNIRFKQDSVGGRTVTGLPTTFKYSGGTVPTFSTTANALDFMSLEYGATENNYMASFLPGMA